MSSALLSLLFCSPLGLLAQGEAKTVVKDVLLPSTETHLNGYLATHLNGAINNRILAQDVNRLIEPFKPENRTETRMWQSEFWGKWFTSAVLAYRYQPTPKLKQVLDQAVAGLMATQTADGYIGNYAPDKRLQQWDIWGQKYCILGLLSYYDLTKNKKMLVAASRLADYLITELNKQDGIIVSKGNYKGMAASSVLEPMCLLYKFTNNKKYLSFAEEIVKQWETPEGPQLIGKSTVNVAQRFPKPARWYSKEQGQKAYEMMSCYEGLLELYRLTGNETYKKAVENTWDNIRKTEINIVGSGASTEMWFGGSSLQDQPIHHYQETCVAVTWLKLNEQLLRLTGEVKYADEVEKTFHNALLGAMSANGAMWAKYTPLNGQRLAGNEQCGMGLNCCDASGPRGLFTFPSFMVTARVEGIQINNYAEGKYQVKSPSNEQITIVQQTNYPYSGDIDITVQLQKPADFEINLRIPYWSKTNIVKVNGEQLTGVTAGKLLKLKRNWENGDKISLTLDMRGRVIDLGNSFALIKGPIVLARDSRLDGVNIAAVLKPVSNKEGYIELEQVESQGKDGSIIYQGSFIPESYTEEPSPPIKIRFCNYASAGNLQPYSFYKVWIPQLYNPSK